MAITGPGLTATFTYDALGRRTSRTINGQSTMFVYDGDDFVAEVDSQAGLVTYLRGLAIDEPFVRQTSGGNEYYHADALGSTLVLTNGAGTSTTTYTYDPFGTTTVTGSSTNALQFTSREHDGTGLYYYRARYYSPTLHRFISEDPIGLAGGDENFYAYTFNSPTNFTDPSGTIGLGGCLAGIVIDAALSGRKPTLASVAGSCALGAIGGQAAKAAFAAVKGALKSIASKLGSQAAKAGNGAQTVDPNKLQHIFDQKRHNLSDVVNQLGSQEKAFNAIQQATQNAAQSQGLKGVFEKTVKVGTEIVTVRGNVIDGTVKIGTAFIP